MEFKLKDLFAEARLRTKEERGAGEAEKQGYLRAGSSGIVNSQGNVAGGCVRKAHVRSLGIETEEISEDKLLMFDLGFANEDVIAQKIRKALPDGYMLLREEEIPIQWSTTNGTQVSGRPDIVICEVSSKKGMTNLSIQGSVDVDQGLQSMVLPAAVPVLGLELKSVHSMWTARDVLFKQKPKLSNLIQAAHYMWKLNVPYKLIYTSYSNLGQGMAGTGGWILKQLPRPGEKYSEYIEYSYFRKYQDKKTGKDRNTKVTREEFDALPWKEREYSIKNLKQFEMVYDLQFTGEGMLQYRAEGDSGKWTDTIVYRDDIERFFEVTSRVAETGQLGPRPTAIDALGDEAGYSDCSYCPMNDICTREETNYSQWLEEVRKLSSSLKKK